MQVKQIKEAIRNLKDDDEVIVVIWTKQEAEDAAMMWIPDDKWRKSVAEFDSTFETQEIDEAVMEIMQEHGENE